jgi:hypothetical protein
VPTTGGRQSAQGAAARSARTLCISSGATATCGLRDFWTHADSARLPPDLARSEAVSRDARPLPAAREALGQALAIFEELEAPLWAEKANTELRRISGRAPASEELTETERLVAKLAAQGARTRRSPPSCTWASAPSRPTSPASDRTRAEAEAVRRHPRCRVDSQDGAGLRSGDPTDPGGGV